MPTSSGDYRRKFEFYLDRQVDGVASPGHDVCWMILYVVLDLAADELDGLHGRIVGRFARTEPRAFSLAIVDDRRADGVIHADSWAGAVDLWRRAWLRLNGPRLPPKAIMPIPDGEPSGEPSTDGTGPHGASLGVRYMRPYCCPATRDDADR
jgi:hypothetical protein